jgi:hypothetical protein
VRNLSKYIAQKASEEDNYTGRSRKDDLNHKCYCPVWLM